MCLVSVCVYCMSVCSLWYLYLCQDRDELLERSQGLPFDDSMSSQLHTQRVVQRWLQVCHVHPGPGHTITHCMSTNNKDEQTERRISAAFTCWRVSRAPLCCWWGPLHWSVEASLNAPPPAASGGRKSRKPEPQCCCGRKGQVRPTLRSLIMIYMHNSVWTKRGSQINVFSGLMWKNLTNPKPLGWNETPNLSPNISGRPHWCSCDWMVTNLCSQVPKPCIKPS